MASGRSWLSGCMEDTLVSMAKYERPLCVVYGICMLAKNKIRGSIVVNISACHAEDPGSIPSRGDLYGTLAVYLNLIMVR